MSKKIASKRPTRAGKIMTITNPTQAHLGKGYFFACVALVSGIIISIEEGGAIPTDWTRMWITRVWIDTVL